MSVKETKFFQLIIITRFREMMFLLSISVERKNILENQSRSFIPYYILHCPQHSDRESTFNKLYGLCFVNK